MNAIDPSHQALSPAVRALMALSDLNQLDMAAIETAAADARSFPPRRDIVARGAALPQPLLIVDGWAFRSRILADGRRQIIDFLLPGDLITSSLAPASIVALTQTMVANAPAPGSDTGGLTSAYAAAEGLSERYLLRQITRLGRLSAYERVADWLCEIHERLARSGSCAGNAMTLPTTQEVIADTLGLTGVHVNRTLQALRRDGLIEVVGKTIRLRDRAASLAIADNYRLDPR
jgi:CRP-like cAMP-binding protein